MIWGYPYFRNPSDIINDVPMKRIGTIWIYINDIEIGYLELFKAVVCLLSG